MKPTIDSPTVLIVEDEPSQIEVLDYNLNSEGYAVIKAMDGDEAILLAEEQLPDLILLDWMLPSVSGIEVCRRLRKLPATKAIPIIMLTARSEEGDRIRGLDTGADDYVVKPYAVKELLARIKALLRRTSPGKVGQILQYHDIRLDTENHKATRADKTLKLGPTEFRLLTTFLERPGRVWSREQLLDRVWGRDIEVDFRTVDVHVGRLRKNLAAAGGEDPIRTIRGMGYALDDA
ncbi:MAG: phosphate regulon transcriptional regulator PhoB [Rhizobiaceae bacterium]